ncbi:hypothetical protein ACHAQA_005673 [Verticillium albo-atrum]
MSENAPVQWADEVEDAARQESLSSSNKLSDRMAALAVGTPEKEPQHNDKGAAKVEKPEPEQPKPEPKPKPKTKEELQLLCENKWVVVEPYVRSHLAKIRAESGRREGVDSAPTEAEILNQFRGSVKVYRGMILDKGIGDISIKFLAWKSLSRLWAHYFDDEAFPGDKPSPREGTRDPILAQLVAVKNTPAAEALMNDFGRAVWFMKPAPEPAPEPEPEVSVKKTLSKQEARSQRLCFNCLKPNHKADRCPEKQQQKQKQEENKEEEKKQQQQQQKRQQQQQQQQQQGAKPRTPADRVPPKVVEGQDFAPRPVGEVHESPVEDMLKAWQAAHMGLKDMRANRVASFCVEIPGSISASGILTRVSTTKLVARCDSMSDKVGYAFGKVCLPNPNTGFPDESGRWFVRVTLTSAKLDPEAEDLADPLLNAYHDLLRWQISVLSGRSVHLSAVVARETASRAKTGQPARPVHVKLISALEGEAGIVLRKLDVQHDEQVYIVCLVVKPWLKEEVTLAHNAKRAVRVEPLDALVRSRNPRDLGSDESAKYDVLDQIASVEVSLMIREIWRATLKSHDSRGQEGFIDQAKYLDAWDKKQARMFFVSGMKTALP